MHTRRLARTALAVAVSACAAVGSGCGNKEDVVTNAKTEGIWIDAGPLDYHVQGSRVLEPGLEPDRSYLKGLPSDVAQPTGKEVWFAVFVRVENKTQSAARSSEDFEIRDTQNKVFRPVTLNPNANPFTYRSTVLRPNQALPVPDSAADFDSFSGSMLLFKIPLDSYQNRPLEFRVRSADGAKPAEASLDLDV
jgi:hypothetical protein